MEKNQNINSAYRMLQLCNGILTQPTGTKMFDMWCSLFHVTKGNEIREYKEVMEKFLLIDLEVRNIRTDMTNTSLSKDTYDVELRNVLALLNPNFFNSDSKSYVNLITNEVTKTLKICSQLLPHQEDLIDVKELDSLITDVEKFKLEIDNKKYPSELTEYLDDQLLIILNAIYNYNIIGIRAFKDASLETSKIILRDREVIKTEEGKKENNRIGKIWKKINDLVVKVDSARRIGEFSIKLFDLVKNNLE